MAPDASFLTRLAHAQTPAPDQWPPQGDGPVIATGPGQHHVLVGARGSGRSVRVAAHAAKLRREVLEGGPTGSVLAHAADLHDGRTLMIRLHGWLEEQVGLEVDLEDLRSALGSGQLVLIVDGVDELDRRRRREFERQLQTAVLNEEIGSTLVVSDGREARWEGRQRTSMPTLTRTDVERLLQEASTRLSKPVANEARSVDRIMRASRGNALLTVLAIEQRLRMGRVSVDRGAVLKQFVSTTLAEAAADVGVSVRALRTECLDLALEVIEGGLRSVPSTDLGPSLRLAVRRGALSTGLLREVLPGRHGFTHRLVAEYCAGMAVQDDMEALCRLVETAGVGDAVGFAARMTDDLMEVSKAIVTGLGLDELHRLGEHLADLDRATATDAYSAIIDEVDKAIKPTSPRILDEGVRELGNDDPETLLDEWDELAASPLRGKARGDQLEDLMERYFAPAFDVTERNFLGGTRASGEFDLVLEPRSSTNFWNHYGPDVGVECKHWQANVGTSPLSVFRAKLWEVGLRLGFLVVSGDVTEPVEASTSIGNRGHDLPLVVLLTPKDIRASLIDEPDGPSRQFFERLIRRTKFRHR